MKFIIIKNCAQYENEITDRNKDDIANIKQKYILYCIEQNIKNMKKRVNKYKYK